MKLIIIVNTIFYLNFSIHVRVLSYATKVLIPYLENPVGFNINVSTLGGVAASAEASDKSDPSDKNAEPGGNIAPVNKEESLLNVPVEIRIQWLKSWIKI